MGHDGDNHPIIKPLRLFRRQTDYLVCTRQDDQQLPVQFQVPLCERPGGILALRERERSALTDNHLLAGHKAFRLFQRLLLCSLIAFAILAKAIRENRIIKTLLITIAIISYFDYQSSTTGSINLKPKSLRLPVQE